MAVENFFIVGLPILGLIIAIYTISVISIVLIPQQRMEIKARDDGFNALRLQILLLLNSTRWALVIPLIYRIFRVFGYDSQLLRAFASLASSLSVYFFIRALVAIFKYKYQGK